MPMIEQLAASSGTEGTSGMRALVEQDHSSSNPNSGVGLVCMYIGLAGGNPSNKAAHGAHEVKETLTPQRSIPEQGTPPLVRLSYRSGR